jgi:hypothetical protein
MPVTTTTGLSARQPLKPRKVYPVLARVLYRRPALDLTNLLGVRLHQAVRENA